MKSGPCYSLLSHTSALPYWYLQILIAGSELISNWSCTDTILHCTILDTIPVLVSSGSQQWTHTNPLLTTLHVLECKIITSDTVRTKKGFCRVQPEICSIYTVIQRILLGAEDVIHMYSSYDYYEVQYELFFQAYWLNETVFLFKNGERRLHRCSDTPTHPFFYIDIFSFQTQHQKQYCTIRLTETPAWLALKLVILSIWRLCCLASQLRTKKILSYSKGALRKLSPLRR